MTSYETMCRCLAEGKRKGAVSSPARCHVHVMLSSLIAAALQYLVKGYLIFLKEIKTGLKLMSESPQKWCTKLTSNAQSLYTRQISKYLN